MTKTRFFVTIWNEKETKEHPLQETHIMGFLLNIFCTNTFQLIFRPISVEKKTEKWDVIFFFGQIQYLRLVRPKSCWQVKVDIGLLFNNQNFLQKWFSATVSILRKRLQTDNSKHCNSDFYSQSSSCRLLGDSVFILLKFLQNKSEDSTKMKKKYKVFFT